VYQRGTTTEQQQSTFRLNQQFDGFIHGPDLEDVGNSQPRKTENGKKDEHYDDVLHIGLRKLPFVAAA
jgi:hypothetical protein